MVFRVSAPYTPGPWQVEEDPMEEQGYKTLVTLPGTSGFHGTWLARVEHNWNEAASGERRISWAEAEANARLIAAAPDLLFAANAMLLVYAPGGRGYADMTLVEAARAAIAKALGEKP